MSYTRFLFSLLAVVWACSTATTERRAAPLAPTKSEPRPVETADEVPVPEPKVIEVPEACAPDPADGCMPPGEFVDELCKKRQPNVALTLFRKGSPWTRTYVRVRDMEAWLVGARSSPAKLKLFEEVLIVRNRQPKGGVQVSGAGSYDVLRWDGTCVSVMSDEVLPRRPPEPEEATIHWTKLDPGVRQALAQNKRIAQRDEQRKAKCDEDEGSPRCEEARAGLSRAIAAFIREGGTVPWPTALE